VKLRRVFPALLVVIALVISACGGQPAAPAPTAPGTPTTPAAKSKYGGTLTAAYATEPSSLAPWRSGDTTTHMVYQAIYDGLVEMTPNMEIVPALAESWTPSADGKTWTFKIRKGVKFHDGTEVNAEAVKFNVELWTTNLPKGGINRNKDIDGVKVIDSHTVELTYKAPNNLLLINLAGKLRAILSPKAVTELGEDFGRKPVGTGPFKFDKWITDSTITLVRNPDYYAKDAAGDKLPYLDKLEFKLIPDSAVRQTALLANEIQFDSGVGNQNVSTLEDAKKFTVFKKPAMGYVGLRLLMTKAPFDKLEVRQALAWATNREAINKAVFFGTAFPGYTMYSPPTPGFRTITPYGPRSVDKAKELLAKAGYPNGFEMEMIVANPIFATIAEVLQAQYKEIGVTVKIMNLERGTFLDGIVKRQHASYLDSLAGRFDPANYYGHLECGATYNGHDYCDKEVDQMVKDGTEKFTSLTDPKRLELFQKAEQKVLDAVPFVPLLHTPILMAWSDSYKDLDVSPPGRIFWTNAHKVK
jgi:peptide/nickel transport system substrate-binding protein